MRYEYTFRNTPGDYWKFRMENHYRNWTGLVSIVYTLSMLALTITKWNSTNGLGKALLLIFLLVFPLFQPLFVYFISIRDAQAIKADTTLSFDETGMEIRVLKHVQRIPWKSFVPDEKGGGMVIQRRSMLVVVPDQMHAYLLTNRVLGTDDEKKLGETIKKASLICCIRMINKLHKKGCISEQERRLIDHYMHELSERLNEIDSLAL